MGKNRPLYNIDQITGIENSVINYVVRVILWVECVRLYIATSHDVLHKAIHVGVVVERDGSARFDSERDDTNFFALEELNSCDVFSKLLTNLKHSPQIATVDPIDAYRDWNRKKKKCTDFYRSHKVLVRF